MIKPCGLFLRIAIGVAALAAATTARAQQDFDDFENAGYVVGNPLTNFNWTGSSSGGLVIDQVADPNFDKVVKLIAPNGGSTKTATFTNWGQAPTTALGSYFFGMDIFSSTDTSNVSNQSIVWDMTYDSNTNNRNYVALEGGLNSVKFGWYSNQGGIGSIPGTPGTATFSSLFTLAAGWNRVVIQLTNIGGASGTETMWLNGVNKGSMTNTSLGLGQGNTKFPNNLYFTRIGGFSGLTGTMKFDRIVTSNDTDPLTNHLTVPTPEPATFGLLAMAAPFALLMLRRRLRS